MRVGPPLRVSPVTLVLVAAFSLGCGAGASAGPEATGSGGESGSGGAGVFIAFASDFQGYDGWRRLDLGVVPPTDNELPGPRALYVNRAPEHGASEFPVGTMIVKAIETGAPSEWQMFAMVKRGGGFNYVGARGWEWFELTQTDDRRVAVQWRGVAPPSGMGYGAGTQGGVCNTCHAGSAANDYVIGDDLSLSGF